MTSITKEICLSTLQNFKAGNVAGVYNLIEKINMVGRIISFEICMKNSSGIVCVRPFIYFNFLLKKGKILGS